jgi:hypothetical protein
MAVVDIVTFRLAPGVDDIDFLDLDRRAQTEVFYAQRGMLRRTTARGGDEEWVVLTLWGSGADADASAEACRHDATVTRWLACLDPASVATRRYQTLD